MSSKEAGHLTHILLQQANHIFGPDYSKTQPPGKTLEEIICYYQDIIMCMPCNVYWIDKNGLTVGCNKIVLDMFNLNSAKEFKGLTFEAMGKMAGWSKRATQKFKADTFEVLQTGQPKLNEREPPVPLANGEMVYFLTNRVPLFNQAKEIVGVVGISTNITALVNSEKAQAALSAAKSNFIALLGTELKTPFQRIASEALALNSIINLGRKRLHAQSIIQEVDRLQTLVQDIVDIAEDYVGNMRQYSIQTFDFKNLLENLCTIHQQRATQRGIALLINYQDGVPNWIDADPFLWRRILNYLVVRAIDGSDREQVVVNIDNTNVTEGFDLKIFPQGPHLNIEKSCDPDLSEQQISESRCSLLAGLNVIQEFMDFAQGELQAEYFPGEGVRVLCRMKVRFNLQQPLSHNAWSPYQDRVRVVLADNTARASIIKKHLGGETIDICGDHDAVLLTLRALQAGQRPCDIVILGKFRQTDKIQQQMALSLAKKIQKEKQIMTPMIVLLTEKTSAAFEAESKAAGCTLVLNPLVSPSVLRTALAAAWEEWVPQKKP